MSGKGGRGGGKGGGFSGGGAKGGGGSFSKGGDSGGSGGPQMKAPGGSGSYISRGVFESNPRAYFTGLHVGQKGKK